jgi:hypothetical protein
MEALIDEEGLKSRSERMIFYLLFHLKTSWVH